MNEIRKTFLDRNRKHRACFVGFVTAGYPSISATPSILIEMQSSGVDIIELGVPFSDPLADGKTIQFASQMSLANGTSMATCFDILSTARSQGLTVPVVMMGYINPFIQFGLSKWIDGARNCGVSGVILVDQPWEEAREWVKVCCENGIAYIPLIAPNTGTDRIRKLCQGGDGFVYVLSRLGVTGATSSPSAASDGSDGSVEQVRELVGRVRECTDLPIAVGFGISTAEQAKIVAAEADGIVIGSKFIQLIKEKLSISDFCQKVSQSLIKTIPASTPVSAKSHLTNDKDVLVGDGGAESEFTYGEFGGRFAPESLMFALDSLDKSFQQAIADPSFWKEFQSYYPFINRPSPLQLAKNLSSEFSPFKSTESTGSGVRIWLKREDLNHTGSHKINNALGQVLLAKRLGKRRIIAETGAGQHGVATATVCAHFNIPCVVYMGRTDTIRQQLNVFRMRLLGAEVVPVERMDGSGEGTLKDAINEAMRDWVTNVESTHYLVGSAIGPDPFPKIVREFQSVIGREVKVQFREAVRAAGFVGDEGKINPDVLVACVGGGSNAIGLFAPFLQEKRQDGQKLVRLIGVEAGGEGVESGKHSAPLTAGTPGVLHGCKTFLMQTADGQIMETHSISAGLDYPGVGPEHAHLKQIGRAEYVAVTDRQALEGLIAMSRLEGIIPALETSHAIYHACFKLASSFGEGDGVIDIVLGVSGRGDKDVEQVQKLLSENFKDLLQMKRSQKE